MRIYRQITEELEAFRLNQYAVKSVDANRAHYLEPCDLRTAFQRDRDRITHSKAFRRLMHKTQVFVKPEGDHYRTRLTHTLEVAQIARTIARALRLNEDLTEAIALGHDIGHTPFGHMGEDILDKLSSRGFSHNKQSVKVLDHVENDGKGLNLTLEVYDGIENHCTEYMPRTLEGQVVRISDKIGYVNHDIQDSIRAGILNPNELPKDAIEAFGQTSSERIGSLIRDVIENSDGKDYISLRPDTQSILYKLRAFMFDRVYIPLDKNDVQQVERIISTLFEYYLINTDALPRVFADKLEKEPREVVVCDYISCMTDRYANKTFERIVDLV